MNSVTLLALLIFTSASRGSSGSGSGSGSSYSDFTELDGEDFQNEFFEDEVTYTSNSEDSTQAVTIIESFKTDPENLEFLTEERRREEGDKSNDIVRLEEIFKHPIEHPASVLSAMNEVAAEKHLSHFLVHPFDHHNPKGSFLNEETKQYQTPKRREVKEWKVSDDYFDSSNMPWSVDAYYPKYQSEYVEDASFSDEKTHEGPAVVVAGDFKDHNNHPKNPQYFQKNYYYNYYPVMNDRKRWSPEETHSPEESKKRMETAVGRKITAPNPCRQYLEFLRYAFERLDDNSEYYYEPNEEYVEEWRERDEPKTHRVFGTQLLGPTFYVDNSGKISQINTNGNSIQVAEGISPDSRISIFSKSSTKPKPVTTPETTTQTSEPTTTPDYSYNMGTSFEPRYNSKPEGSTKKEIETTTAVPYTTPYIMRETERSQTTIRVAEPTTVEEYDYNPSTSTISTEEYYGRMGRPMERRPSVESDITTTRSNRNWMTPSTTTTTTIAPLPLPVTVNNSSNENRIKVKTILSIEDSTEVTRPEDADCKDKMLPCPDTVNITYPLNGYCNRYVSCESGKAIRRTCPEGLHFNPIIKSCDLPHNSFCTYVCPQPNGNFGIPGDCGGYFVCKNSNPEYRMCPPRMHWDINRNICTFSQLSSCPMKCFRDNEVRHYEGDCKAYIVCLNGIPYYHKCPPNTKFDRTSLVCVPDQMSNCVDDPRLLTNTLNPNTLCKDVQIQLNTKSWCRSFLPFN